MSRDATGKLPPRREPLECEVFPCDLPECDLPECDLPECDLPECELPECELPECELPECELFDRRIQELLDRGAEFHRDPRLIAHAITCEPCHESLDAYATLFQSLEQSEIPAPPGDLVDRVCARLEPATTSFDRRVWYALASLAAGFLLIVAPMVYHAGLASRAVVADRSGSRSTVQSPGTDFASNDVAGSNAMSSDPVRAMFESMALQIGEVDLPPLRQVNTITTAGFRPIAMSFESAITALRNSLPLIKDDAPRKPQASFSVPRAIA